MASKQTKTEFDSLVEDILSNPDKALDPNISEEDILKAYKQINPYASGLKGEKGKTVVMSHTNLRAEYIKRFTMTSMVGFLFRMFGEWEVPAELRRWVPKNAAKKARAQKAKAKKEGKTAPFTPAQLVEITSALAELAKLAASAAAEADEAVAVAKEANDELTVLELGEVTGDKAQHGRDVQEQQKKTTEALKVADAALAKARGLQYSAMHSLRKFGMESDARIDEMAAVARQHKEVREVIDKDPIVREKPGMQEMPGKAAKNIIGNFLRTWFEYDPDAHVRSAYDQFKIVRDTGEVVVPGVGAVKVDAKDPDRLPLEVIRAKAPPRAQGDEKTFRTLTQSRETRAAALHFLRDAAAAAALGHALDAPDRFRRYLAPLPRDSPARPAVDVIPPQDTFHRWGYYMEVNMEELRAATDAIYHEKPDLDSAVIVYDCFEGAREKVDADVEAFRNKHIDEVISDIKAVDTGEWTFLADFKENREKIDFYNKHTDILKRILDRHAEDKKLGADLMRNRVRQAKAKNIREAGPDAPGLSEYKSNKATSAGLGAMGAETVISREEMFRLERARGNIKAAKELEAIDEARKTIRELTEAGKVRELMPEEERRLKDAQKDLVVAQEMIEVPDDAIQVDVWTHDTGSGKFGKSKFYTKAEAPVHLTAPQNGGPPPAQVVAPNESTSKAAMGRLSNVQSPGIVPSGGGEKPLTPSVLGGEKPLAPFALEYLNTQIEQERKAAEERMKSVSE